MKHPIPKILVTTFAEVPAQNSHTPALLAFVSSIRSQLDLITVKNEMLAHIQRIGHARMLRVPLGSRSPAEQWQVFARALKRQIESEPYEVVHVRGAFEGDVAISIRSHYDFRLVYEIAQFPSSYDLPEWEAAHARAIEHAEVVIAPTSIAAEVVRERHPSAAGKVEVLPPSVDPGRYDFRERVTPGAPRLLYLGELSEERDLPCLLDALALVIARRPIQALLAGEPYEPRRTWTQERLAVLGLGGSVQVSGLPQPESAPDIVGECDIGLVPAGACDRFLRLGDVPAPLLEHLASRKPVVAANVPGVRELLRDGDHLLLYPPGDPRALADAILELLEDSSLRARLADAGYGRARRHLSTGAWSRGMRRIYERLVPGSQSVDPWLEGFLSPDERALAQEDSGRRSDTSPGGRSGSDRFEMPKDTQPSFDTDQLPESLFE